MSLVFLFQEHEEIGEKRGIEIGEARGKEIGALATKVSQVKQSKGKATEDIIITVLGMDKEQYRRISEAIEDAPDMSDWEIAEALLADGK
ncbi:MAG: hypothetical protein IKX88_13355 [Thermoguttaceae bacterium]|nr:hypothetical protein [Thermoguttaceae bacterium]MBR5759575.1 hypothetical protein [Thermoguttaceae bacterium]